MSALNYDIETFCEKLKGNLAQKEWNGKAGRIVIDSRKFLKPENAAFFAISGSRNNGHHFIREIYARGGRLFVVSEKLDYSTFPGATFIEVVNVVEALQSLAANHRAEFHYPLIAITGSNGKTIVKEWLFQLLYRDYHIVRSPKSYNSQVGVPLSVMLMDKAHDLAIFEAGISQIGEMGKLAKMLCPTIGILTNIGAAHQENFKSIEQKINEKLLLFENADYLIYCKDHKEIAIAIAEKNWDAPPKFLTWSANVDADLAIEKVSYEGQFTKLQGTFENKIRKIKIPFTNTASIENASHLWLLLLHLKMEDREISKRFEGLSAVAMRLEQLEGIGGSVLINDAYNSDINSLEIALDYLKSQTRNAAYTTILSDILQSGEDDKAIYGRMAEMVRARKIESFIGIGPALSASRDLFHGIDSKFFTNTQDFLDVLDKKDFKAKNILLKAARDFKFERIADILQEKTHKTILEIDLGKMVDNLNYIKSLLKPETQLMVMVKAFAYGAGSYDIARLMEYHGVHYLAVAYADEGISLRESGITSPIMVLNPEISSYAAMVRYKLEPQIYSFNALRKFSDVLATTTADLPYAVHIKINTGMNRLGFDPDQMEELSSILEADENLQVRSVFSHLAASDDPDADQETMRQIEQFSHCADILEMHLKITFMRHILNSGGILRMPEAQMDMVRLGLALYGISSHKAYREKLEPVSSLFTTISQVRLVKAGKGVGYNPVEKLQQDAKIAVLPVGYADGLPRLLGNGVGYVLISGKKVPFIGNICMDMAMVDVSGIDCSEGDEVEVFGSNLDIYEMADHLKTIPYEVLTNISQRVKRVFVQD